MRTYRMFFPALMLAIALILVIPLFANAACTTLKDGVLTYSPGHYLYGSPIPVGYDSYGYNYYAHLFNGSYANVYLGGAGFPPYEGDDASYLAANPTVVTH